MSLDVIKGPFDSVPAWSPSTKSFMQTSDGLRELGEPRIHGPFETQVYHLLRGIVGRRPQFWQVDISERAHPEVRLDLLGRDGFARFNVQLLFTVRVIDATRVLQTNIRNLDGYFTSALRHEIESMARRYRATESLQFRDEILSHFGDGNKFTDDRVELARLAVEVRPVDPDGHVLRSLRSALPVHQAAIESRVHITQAELDAFERGAGNMTIDALARAAIATANPRLIDAYNRLRSLHVGEDQRNWERLKFLVENNVIEAHHLEKHLGPLGPDLIRRLASQSSLPSADAETLVRLRARGPEVATQDEQGTAPKDGSRSSDRAEPDGPARLPDDVDCSVFAQPHVTAGTTITIQALLHRAEALVAAAKLATSLDLRATRITALSLRCRLLRGTTVDLFLECSDLTVENPVATVRWNGGPDRALFVAQVPKTLPAGSINLRLHLAVDGVAIGDLEFKLQVAAAPMDGLAQPASTAAGPDSAYRQVGDDSVLYRRAFVSYARRDFERVSMFAQGLEESGIGVFVDVDNLEPGDHWEQELGAEIAKADVFYLMWSRSAAVSNYVEMEARQAVTFESDPARKRPRVKPITLERAAPPPPDFLRKYHFDSRWLSLREAQKTPLFHTPADE